MKYKIKKAVDGSLLSRINALIPPQQMVRNIIEDIPDTYIPIDYGKKAGELIAQNTPVQTSTKYTINKGDTLSAIAAKHKTTVAELAKANGLSGDQINHIVTGKQLILPGNANNIETKKSVSKKQPIIKKESNKTTSNNMSPEQFKFKSAPQTLPNFTPFLGDKNAGLYLSNYKEDSVNPNNPFVISGPTIVAKNNSNKVINPKNPIVIEGPTITPKKSVVNPNNPVITEGPTIYGKRPSVINPKNPVVLKGPIITAKKTIKKKPSGGGNSW